MGCPSPCKVRAGVSAVVRVRRLVSEHRWTIRADGDAFRTVNQMTAGLRFTAPMSSTGGFSTRSAVTTDAAFLATMVAAAVNWDPDYPPATAEKVLSDHRNAHYVEAWPLPDDIGVIAIDSEGAPIGAAWLRLFTSDDPGYGFVAADVPELSVGVVEPWRGKGVGRALLREVLRCGASRGFTRISLSVERANRARGLYLDEGFVVVASGPDADTMVKG